MSSGATWGCFVSSYYVFSLKKLALNQKLLYVSDLEHQQAKSNSHLQEKKEISRNKVLLNGISSPKMETTIFPPKWLYVFQ